jgi:hypothetical protein
MVVEVVENIKAATAGATIEFGRDAEKAALGGVLKGVASREEQLHLKCPEVWGGGVD